MLGYERILVVWMWRRSGRQWFSPRGCVRGYDVDTVYFLKSFYTYIKLGNNSESSVNIKNMHFVLRHTTSQCLLPESLVSENPTSHAV